MKTKSLVYLSVIALQAAMSAQAQVLENAEVAIKIALAKKPTSNKTLTVMDSSVNPPPFPVLRLLSLRQA